MSSLRAIDLQFVSELVEFVRGTGYVLDFSNSRFSEFFETEIGIDIDSPPYAEFGASKGRRLRSFLKNSDNEVAARTLKSIWEYRAEYLVRHGLSEPSSGANERFRKILDRLSPEHESSLTASVDLDVAKAMRQEMARLKLLRPQERGFEFERFLRNCFDRYGLVPRDSFRNTGEQVDGSFLLDEEVYLLEAKWHLKLTGASDLHAFHGKLEQKASWARGLFVSFAGYSPDGLLAFGPAKRLICVDGRDLCDIFEQGLSLKVALQRKVRRAAETGRAFIPVKELFSTRK